MRKAGILNIFIAGIGVVLLLLGVFALFRYVQSALTIHTDFSNDYSSAQALRAGRSIYARRNNHPPLTAFFFLPWSFLPYTSAFVLWSCFSLALYLALIVLVGEALDIHLERHWQILLFGVALIWYPFLAHMALGQFSLVLAACVIGGWWALRRQHEYGAGFLFGIATALKLFPGLLLVVLLVRRRWRALGVMVLTTLGGVLGPLLVVPWREVVRYFMEISPQNAAQYAVFPVNSAISGVVSRLFVSGPWVAPLVEMPTLASFFIAGLSLFVVALLIWHVWRLPATTWGTDIALAFACLAMLLISPITWQHGFTLLILPLGLLLRTWMDLPARRLRLLGLLAFTLLSLPDVELARALMALSLPERMPWWQSLVLDAGAAALLLLWWLLARYSARMNTTLTLSR